MISHETQNINPIWSYFVIWYSLDYSHRSYKDMGLQPFSINENMDIYSDVKFDQDLYALLYEVAGLFDYWGKTYEKNLKINSNDILNTDEFKSL